MRISDDNINTISLIVFWTVFIITPIVAWFTHVVRCINSEQWLFLIAGAVAVPIGIIHGIGIWLGVF